MGELGFCTVFDIAKEALAVIITGVSADTGLPLWLSKLLQNKPLIFPITALRCYFLYLDTYKLVLFVPTYLYPLILIGLFQKRGRKTILTVTLIMPIVFILNPFGWNLGTKIFLYQQFFLLLSLIGLIKLLLLLITLITRYKRI